MIRRAVCPSLCLWPVSGSFSLEPDLTLALYEPIAADAADGA